MAKKIKIARKKNKDNMIESSFFKTLDRESRIVLLMTQLLNIENYGSKEERP